MQLFYSNDYSATSHAIDATQKPRWIAESILNFPITNVVLESPTAVSVDQLILIHDIAYVEAVRTGSPRKLASSSSYPWNGNTWTSAIASCGGMVAACSAALCDGVSGSLSAGFHHAKRERGHLHCVFNGLALAIHQLHTSGVKRILHIDLDAHCGGGTFSLVGALSGYHQLDVSCFQTDKYTPTGESTLDLVESAEVYLSTVADRLDQLAGRMADFEICVYYAGMDPHEGSAFGGLPGIDAFLLAERDEMVFSSMRRHNVPVAFGLGGGYLGPGLNRNGLVDLHRTTIKLGATCAKEQTDEREPG
ncbi:hypothetical protein SH139x_004273 [Planctomycetaceae bacterium SH139]